MWEWNIPSGSTRFSPKWFTMLGYQPDELPQSYQTWACLLHPEDKSHALRTIQDHLEGSNERFEVEFRLRCKGGQWKWLQGRGKVVQRDPSGEPILVMGTHTDIDQRKMNEENLQHRSSFMETMLDTIPCPVFYKDRQGVYRGCNVSFLKQILGLPHEKVVGSTVYDLPEAIPRELADVYHKKDMELIDSPGHQTYEAEVRCADGLRRNFVFHKATAYDQSGQACGIVGVMIDVTEQRQAEQALLEGRERLESLLHAMPMGLVIIDKTSQEIVEVNPKAVTLIGAPPEQIIGSVCHKFICPAEKGKCPIVDLGMEVNSSEKELLTSEGESIPILKTVIPFNSEGREYLLECFKDIRDLKETENKKVENEKLKALIEIAGSICHEVNQPLQIISGFSELLLMNNEKADEKSMIMIKTINDQIYRINSIIKKLLNVTGYRTKPYLNGNIVDFEKSSAY